MPVIDLGDAQWTPKNLREKLYADYPDIVYTIGAKAYLAANSFLSNKTIVFSSVVNYKRLPLEGQRYGVAEELHGGMQLMLMRHLFPQFKSLAIVYSAGYTAEWFEELRTQGQAMGLEIKGAAATSLKDAQKKLTALLTDSDAAILLSDPVIFKEESAPSLLLTLCDEQRKPAISFLDSLKTQGATLTIAIDTPTTARQAASIVKTLAAGEKPAKPFVPPAGSHLTLNLKKIRALGISYNQAALTSINDIIE